MTARILLWSVAHKVHRYRYAVALATLILIAIIKDWPPPSCEKKG